MADTSDGSVPEPASSSSVAAEDANRPSVGLPRQRGGGAARSGGRPVRAPVVVAAAVNTLWAAVVSFLPVLVAVAAVTMIGAHRPAPWSTVRYSLGAWLLAHGVPLLIGGYPVGLVPLAASVLAVWRLARAGRNTTRAIGARRSRTLRPALWVAAAIGFGYGWLGAGCAVLARGPGFDLSPLRAGLTTAAFGGLASFAGAGLESGIARRLWARVPAPVRDAIRTGVVAALLILGSGAAACGIAVAVSGDTAAAMLRNYHAGVAGQSGIMLLCLVYAPNFAVWVAAYLTGPGFTLAGVPDLPVFAGLPGHPVTGAGQILLVMPVFAGIAAGLLLVRRRRPALNPRDPMGGWRTLAGPAAVSGVVAGGSLALVGRLAAGSLGTGLLTNTGQVVWQFGVVGGIGVAIGASLGVVAILRRPSDTR